MPFQYGNNLLTQNAGLSPENIEVPFLANYAPSSTNTALPGKRWVYINNSEWVNLGNSSIGGSLSSNWVELATSSGNVLSVTGTANEITASPTTGAVVLSIPSTFIAPGSIASTTTLTGGTGITATTGNIVASAGNITTTLGSITSATTLTATLGAITATNGNLVLGTAGNKLMITTGSNASCGVSGAMSGTPGAVVVSTSACTASSVILFSRATTGGTPGNVSITAQSSSGFTLTSTGNETSTFNYIIIN